MDYLIIGSGAAGVSAAREIIREFDKKQDSLTIISKESEAFYYRPRLIQCLSGEINVKDIIINDRDWFAKNGIDLKLEEEVIRIVTNENKVVSNKGEYHYDRLLLAHGAKPYIPPITGVEKEKIFTLRNFQDAENIHQQARKSDTAVVIGGGLLGLESAFNLKKVDLKVYVVEVAEHLLARQLDSQGGIILKKKMESMGCNFFLASLTSEFHGDEKVEAVELNNGTKIETDMVLLSTGIRSNTELVEGTGIAADKGIIVNEKMETNLENIYAAGDVAEFEGRVYGIWAPAMEQGKTAGKNMAGAAARFSGFVPSYTLKVAGNDVTSLGVLDEDNDIISEVKSDDENYCRIFKNRGDKPVGAIIIGQYEEKDDIIKEIKEG